MIEMLKQNSFKRWELGEHELTSGSVLEIQLGDHWITGRMEYSHEWQMYVLLVPNGKATILLTSSLTARLPEER